MIKSVVHQAIEQYQSDPEFIAELLALDITERVVQLMTEQGVSRADLARRLEVSNAYITKLLAGNTNMTLRTLAGVALALGTTPKVGLEPKRRPWSQRPSVTLSTGIEKRRARG